MERWPQVGRETEFTRASELLGRGVGVIASGETGIGKSTFLRSLLDGGGSDARPAVSVRGRTVEPLVPFGAFPDAVTALGEQPTVAEVALAVRAGVGGDRFLLVVDDADLLDTASARVVALLVQEGATLLAAVTGSCAGDPLGPLWRAGLCERIDLTGLDIAEVCDLLEVWLEGPVDYAVAMTLLRHTLGNPLYLRELTRAALAGGQLTRRSRGWHLAGELPVGSGLHDLFVAGIDAQPAGTRAALEFIAVGEPLRYDVAVRLIGEENLSRLEDAHLIRIESGGRHPIVAMDHPLRGDVLRGDLPFVRRRRLQLRLARALSETGEPTAHDVVRAAQWRLDSGAAAEPEDLLAAARTARLFGLEAAERLTRAAHATGRSTAATVLLAEILTHRGRPEEAAELLAALPPDGLLPEEREAVGYCAAVGSGLLGEGAGTGADLIAPLLEGAAGAGTALRALQASLLSLDGRFTQAIEIGGPILADPLAAPGARVTAALAVVGGLYWTGRLSEAVALTDEVGPMASAQEVRAGTPYAAAALELLAVCALVDQGRLDAAEERAQRLARNAGAGDQFAVARADYCRARVALTRGRAGEAARLLRRCAASLGTFDAFMTRHVHDQLAVAEAASGDTVAAGAALKAGGGQGGIGAYLPEGERAAAAVLAAGLLLPQAAERAAWGATLASDRGQWTTALWACHDAARYRLGSVVSTLADEAALHVEGELASCVHAHIRALASQDGQALDVVGARLAEIGALGLAVEAFTEASLAHMASGRSRAATRSHSLALELAGETDVRTPWLVVVPGRTPLTARENQIVALAAEGLTDAAIAERLGISFRTVQTHLEHAYGKLGITGRRQLHAAAGPFR